MTKHKDTQAEKDNKDDRAKAKWHENPVIRAIAMLIVSGGIGTGGGMFANSTKTEADIQKAVQYQIQEYTLKREVDNARLQEKVSAMEKYWQMQIDNLSKDINEIKNALK